MDLKIFDVEHGACALLTCDNNSRLMVDCGHNATTGWKPGAYLKGVGISTLEMLAITNYDEDHVSGIADLCDEVDIRWLWRNRSVSASDLHKLKSEDGMGDGIERLAYEIAHVFTGDRTSPQPTFQGLERKAFCADYPKFEDENNLSMAVFLKCHGTGVLFTGDLERAGWLELLKETSFQQALRDTSVFVASHHGRENGCCDEVFDYCKPYYVIISDKGYMHETQETVDYYRARAKGGPFRDGKRHVLTTRRDGCIGFSFSNDSWGPY